MGLFDFMGGGDGSYTPQQQQLAQSSGVDPAQVKAAQQQGIAQLLTQFGGTMLAAGQGGPIGERGRILAQGLGNMQIPDANKSILNSQQMQIYAQNLAQKKQDFALTQQARDKINGMDDLSDAQKTGAMLDPVGFLKQQSASDLALGQSKAAAQQDFDTKVQQYVSGGMDPVLAKKLVAGTIVQGKGIMGNPVFTDISKATIGGGTPMGGTMGDIVDGSQSGGGTGAPMTTGASPTLAPRPAVGQPAAPGGAVPGVNGNPVGFKALPYGDAFGPSSKLDEGINATQGFLNIPHTHNPTSQAVDNINTLNNQIKTTLSADIGTHRNTTYTAKSIDSLLPQPGHFWSDPEGAFNQYTAVAGNIDGEIARLRSKRIGVDITDPKDMGVVSNQIGQLSAVRNKLQTVLDGWNQGGDGGTPIKRAPLNAGVSAGASGGGSLNLGAQVGAQIAANNSQKATSGQQIKEGDIAHDPQTGHTIIARGGKWVDM